MRTWVKATIGGVALVAIAVAALLLEERPDDLMLIMPSDHSVRDPEAFRDAVIAAAKVAQDGHLVTFGIQPTQPATAYGYIKQGKALTDSAHAVERFVEKPDAVKAEPRRRVSRCREGGHLGPVLGRALLAIAALAGDVVRHLAGLGLAGVVLVAPAQPALQLPQL
jgi:hypothetical protein